MNLNLVTIVTNQYKEAARASQRGMKKLQRKVQARQQRIDFLENFIANRQLSSDLAQVEQRIKEERLAAWMAQE